MESQPAWPVTATVLCALKNVTQVKWSRSFKVQILAKNRKWNGAKQEIFVGILFPKR